MRDDSLRRELVEDEEAERSFPNRESRPVWNGHYVGVLPTPLKSPKLIAYTTELAEELGITKGDMASSRVVNILSGNTANEKSLVPWATPYAVSVLGNEIASPDPFNGYGYGDGRAISIGEFVSASRTSSLTSVLPRRWELQLKGAGTTPFSRHFDGRAVLRSSVREFLVSEAMHHLGVPTTRALSLIVSGDEAEGSCERVARAWYAPRDGENDRKAPPSDLVHERCAITCRAAPSFVRLGSLELFARRYRRAVQKSREPGGADRARSMLLQLLLHSIRREFPGLIEAHTLRDQASLDARLHAVLPDMLDAFAKRQVTLVCEWLRCGYVQGNMNSDNCLLSGRTMDYGPFGFVERYDPLFTPFTSDPMRNCGFERQPLVAQINVAILARIFGYLLDESHHNTIEHVVNETFPAELHRSLCEMRRKKLGLLRWDDEISKDLWQPLSAMMAESSIDFTIFWRQLASFSCTSEDIEDLAAGLFESMRFGFYEAPGDALRDRWLAWMRAWMRILKTQYGDLKYARDASASVQKSVSPKYIPREWMLRDAYTAAENGDYTAIHELQILFRSPYDEHSPEMESKYYGPTPVKYRDRGGISYYS